MVKYYRNKEELYEHYFDIFKDIVDAIATSEYEEDLNELTFSFDGMTYISFGKVEGDSVKEFVKTEIYRLFSARDKKFRTTDEDLEKYNGNLKTFTVGLNKYAYIKVLTHKENIQELNKMGVSLREFSIINIKGLSWNYVEDCLTSCENDKNFNFTDSYFSNDLILSKRNFTLKSKTIINNVLAKYGCIADSNYWNGMMIINSIYYDLENTLLDFPKSANNQLKDISDFVNLNFQPLNPATAYTQIYFAFFKDNKQYAIYCDHLIDNNDTFYQVEINKVCSMLKHKGAEFVCTKKIRYDEYIDREETI